MKPNLLAALSRLFHAEADDAIPAGWNAPEPTPEQLAEHDRLRDIADELGRRAARRRRRRVNA